MIRPWNDTLIVEVWNNSIDLLENLPAPSSGVIKEQVENISVVNELGPVNGSRPQLLIKSFKSTKESDHLDEVNEESVLSNLIISSIKSEGLTVAEILGAGHVSIDTEGSGDMQDKESTVSSYNYLEDGVDIIDDYAPPTFSDGLNNFENLETGLNLEIENKMDASNGKRKYISTTDDITVFNQDLDESNLTYLGKIKLWYFVNKMFYK